MRGGWAVHGATMPAGVRLLNYLAGKAATAECPACGRLNRGFRGSPCPPQPTAFRAEPLRRDSVTPHEACSTSSSILLQAPRSPGSGRGFAFMATQSLLQPASACLILVCSGGGGGGGMKESPIP